jgi:hypothetical protein
LKQAQVTVKGQSLPTQLTVPPARTPVRGRLIEEADAPLLEAVLGAVLGAAVVSVGAFMVGSVGG